MTHDTRYADEKLLAIISTLDYRQQGEVLAVSLGLPFLQEAAMADLPEGFILLWNDQGLALQQTGHKAPGPVQVDFAGGAVDHRRKFGGGKGQMIAKAVGIKAGVYPHVLDATAGLGRDAFVLATLGCHVMLLERSPVVAALLAEGLQRGRDQAAGQDPELSAILARMHLIPVDGRQVLASLAEHDRPDVIYLDPMFPERQKSADVKKEMRAFHALVGRDDDADSLLEVALGQARYRVVVKRPRKAPPLGDRVPSYVLEGKTSRFDIYALRKLPDKLPEA